MTVGDVHAAGDRIATGAPACAPGASMTTKLDKPLRRALVIDREPYVVTITPAGLKLTKKGKRKGLELAWQALVSGDAALAVALNASLRAFPSHKPKPLVRSRSR